jgi:hypothetical protein
MLDSNKNEKDWDDLDLYDRNAANIRRELRRINLEEWVRDLYTIDPDLFDNLKRLMDRTKNNYR